MKLTKEQRVRAFYFSIISLVIGSLLVVLMNGIGIHNIGIPFLVLAGVLAGLAYRDN